MKLVKQYLRYRWRIVAAGAVCFVLFLISFWLYHLPIAAVLYPTMLCVAVCLGFIFFDFQRVRRRHRALQQVRSLTDAVTGEFPVAEGIEEADYQQIIRRFSTEFSEVCRSADRKYADMIDYYTVWVHQIKTPIASMRLHLQNEDSPLARTLTSDLFRVEQYVEMVLTYLRLNTDSTDYVIRCCDLDAIIRQTVKKFAGEFIARKLRLEYEPVHATVVTDEKWLGFVIEQVLSNALKYTPAGSVSITLEPEKKLCIRDTGIGIAAEDLPRIFENGFTGYNGRSDKKASGIGLYLCRRICGNLGHGISVSSQVDAGTCVTIDLNQRGLQVE